jgi:hypothetical protein
MELTVGASLSLVSCLYLLAFTSPASAKCHGKWAIHACFGGNGKRSDPSLSLKTNIEPSLLHRVLISDAQKLQQLLQAQKEDLGPQDDLILVPTQNEDEGYQGVDEDSYRGQVSRSAPEVRGLRRYLHELELRHQLRKRQGDLM